MFKSLVPNIMVESVNDTIAYYSDNFGFTCVMSVPEEGEKVWAMIKKDDVTLMLQNRESIVAEMPEFGNMSLGGSLSFFVSVTEINELFKSVKNKINVIKEPFDTFYNTTEFIFRDINGYIVTMSEHKDA